MIPMFDYQMEAIRKLRTGSILCGGVGSGKSRTSLAYYYICQGGNLEDDTVLKKPKDLYIITTARKRDTLEWDAECSIFGLSQNRELSVQDCKLKIDSWNNIQKYKDVTDAFFIFDEDRVIGYGAWTKAFLKIAKVNDWILLSATPGDTWMDYIPLFIANGFYKNKTEFITRHVVYSRYSKFPKVDRYVDTERLIRLRKRILVDMDFKRETVSHHEDLFVPYDIFTYKELMRNRWNVDKDQPIQNAGELCYALRKIVNSDPSRALEVKRLVDERYRVIIFYNYDYELEILRNINYGEDVEVAEWNGHKHQPIPETKPFPEVTKWVYLVQYNAGAEGWNCISTDTIIFYSQNYSYKVVVQASGRIDRLNTPYKHLFYYHLKSRAPIDIAIGRALKQKKKFNERKFVEG